MLAKDATPSSKHEGGRSIMDFALLERYGIPVLPYAFVRTLPQAVAAAGRIGYPVALKLVSSRVLHKSEHHALALNLKSAQTVELEFNRLSHLAARTGTDTLLVQKYAPARLELIVGGRTDSQFGPVLLVGLGGIYTELLHDMALRICPLDEAGALDMLRSLKSYPILSGARGQRGVDERALANLLVNASKLMMEHQPRELDINPLLVVGDQLLAADVRLLR